MLNDFSVKILNEQIEQINSVKCINKDYISYEYDGVECFSCIKAEQAHSGFIDYAEALIRNDMSKYKLLTLTKQSSEHIEHIEKAIGIKYKEFLKENKKEMQYVASNALIHKIIDELKKESKTTTYKESYIRCLEQYKEYAKKEIEVINKRVSTTQQEAATLQDIVQQMNNAMNEDMQSMQEGIKRVQKRIGGIESAIDSFAPLSKDEQKDKSASQWIKDAIKGCF